MIEFYSAFCLKYSPSTALTVSGMIEAGFAIV